MIKFTRRPALKLKQHKATTKYKWYHGALFFVGITVVERGLEKLSKKAMTHSGYSKDDKAYYNSLKQAVFAPPAQAFPIAWLLNDVATIWGNLRVLNKAAGTAGRSQYLALQEASWGIYALFTAMHFGLRSPLNALVLTCTHAGLNIASEAVALQQLKDKKVALSLVPVLAWLAVALPTAITTALWNRDNFYKAGPFIRPKENWLKHGHSQAHG